MARTPKLKSGFLLNEIMGRYYTLLRDAPRSGKTVALVGLGFPSEILYAFDMLPLFPQSEAALTAARGMAGEMLELAEENGVPADICSELKIACTQFGLETYRDETIYPRPDVILVAGNVCGAMVQFGRYLSRRLHIPFFLLDIPFTSAEAPSDHFIRYVVEQLRSLLSLLEEISGLKTDLNRLRQAKGLAARAVAQWQQIAALARTRPTPVDALEMYSHMFPLTHLRGTRQAITYYCFLAEELTRRVRNRHSPILQERYRILWDYLPVYHRSGFFAELFALHGGIAVTSTFFHPVRKDFHADAGDGLEALLTSWAVDFMQLAPAAGIRTKLGLIEKLVDRYGIDGVVLHCDRSCKPQSLPQYQLRMAIEQELRRPVLLLDADSVDPRLFSTEQIITRVEAFFESMDQEDAA
jgi:benzoyl-CoA reductase/2-hydroxyglutaryl-CoA dehydratase subunit BcrC/BadD/HgdB